jgi:hypothetical protein
VVWEQHVDNIRVFQSVLIAHTGKHGELVSLSSTFVPKADQSTKLSRNQRNALLAAPPVNAREAVVAATRSIGEVLRPEDVTVVGAAPPTPDGSWKLKVQPMAREQAPGWSGCR